MFFYLIPLYSRIMFVGITALAFFLAIMLLRWDAWKRYPVMSLCLTWQAVCGTSGLLIALFGPGMAYFYNYYVGTFISNLIAFGVALELYYKIFDPRIGLFAWGRRHVVIIMSVSLAVAIVVGSLFAGKNGGSLTRTMVTLNEIMHVALWATFCILWIYSRSLGFSLRPRVAGIAMGFILYLTVAVLCIFIAARFSLSAARTADQVRAAAEFLSLAWWLGVFWGEEKLPESEVAIPEPVEEMPEKYAKTWEAAARML
jgi:hypothetical protein